MSDLVVTENASTPAAPPVNTLSIYAKVDGNFYIQNSSGVEKNLVGPAGPNGANGQGVPPGGTVGQIIVKDSATNYDTSWQDPSINLEQSFTLVNNQVSPANITGLFIDSTLYGGFSIDYRIYRNTTSTGATELSEQGWIIGTYKPVANTWEISDQSVAFAGITFSITAAGQVKYTSTNITGTPSHSYIKFKWRVSSL